MATTIERAQGPDADRGAPEDGFARTWKLPTGFTGFFTILNNTNLGQRYMITAFVLFLIGGLESLFMRVQLARPENDFLGPESYNELFTMHGTTMMFLFAIPFIEGLATYLLPLMLGARDMPFPRYNQFNYWCYLLGGLILYSSFLVGTVPQSGWFAYVPLSGPDYAGQGMNFWLFGLTLAELAAIGAAIEIIITVLRTRAPGMSLARMPIFAWAMLAVAFMIILAFVPLLVAALLLELDRVVGTAFFDPAAGGSPLLWQHLFWIFGHPEVYVMFLPGAAIISHVLPVHARHRLVAYPLVVVAIVVTAVMSLGLWVHHMYTTGLPPLTLSFFTAASMTIAIASGLQVLAWLATLLLGRPRFTVPMMFSLGFVLTFVAGGVTGVMVASVPFDEQVHDTYFVVAHFHYVVLGGMLFPIFAGLYHWWPKMNGRMLDDRLGHLSFWLVFLGFHTTFFPMHLIGLWGMPRRVYTYPSELGIGTANLISSIGSFVLASGVLVLVANFATSRRYGPPAPDDPWGGDTLEWATTSPPPPENFPIIPVVAGRHPRWEPVPDDRAYPGFREAFDRAPDFRATPTTNVLTAEPDAAARLAQPTAWPLVPALGLAVIAVGLLGEWYWLALLGTGVILVGLVGWMVSNEAENGDEEAHPLAGRFHFELPGPRSVSWWGAAGFGAVAVVAMTTLAFSALYLQVNAAAWPPGDTLDRPGLSLAATVLLAGALAAAWWGSRRGRRPDGGSWEPTGAGRAQTAAGLGALLVGIAASVLILLVWLTGDVVPTAHAYDSAAMTMLGAQLFVVSAALAVTVVALWARRTQDRDTRPGVLLQCAAVLWGASLCTWLLTWATTDLLPSVVI